MSRFEAQGVTENTRARHAARRRGARERLGVSPIALAAVLVACGKGGVEGAAQAPAAATSSTPVEVASDAPSAPYPTPPQGPPPVPPPAGRGNEVPVQRYIAIDQFGYQPSMTKVAVLVDPVRGWNASDEYTPGSSLEVRRWADGSVAFSSRVTPWNGGQVDAVSGDRGSWFNFTKLEEPGLYYVFDPERQVRSHPFEIAEDVYVKVLKTATRTFYFNRANFEKKAPFACVGDRCWAQGVDYLGPAQDGAARSVLDRENQKTARDLRGGWWDAGDVNKYVTFSGEAVHQLLSAYDERPEAFTDDFGIPESGNGIPDLIDELLVELAWLKRMQPDDLGGGVLPKLGNVDHGDPLPEASRMPRYYYPAPCSSATISLAGELAHAAAVLRNVPGQQEYAHDLVQRAERAWQHYNAHPKSDACDDGTIKSGDSDKSLHEQEQMAVTAAVYLLSVTGKGEYAEFVSEHYLRTEPFESDTWSTYRHSQGDALLYYTHLEQASGSVASAITQRKRTHAESIDIYRFRPQFDLYRAFMRKGFYHWGSNEVRSAVANTNLDLLVHRLTKQSDEVASTRDRAAGLLHSFHGVNAMQLVYLTNMYAVGGDACADEAYHTWFRDGDPRWDNARSSTAGPAPGYVTGGANADYCKGQPSDHACTRSPIREQPPAKAYIDSNTGWDPKSPYDKTWELTEPSIYNQAGYVRLVSKFVH